MKWKQWLQRFAIKITDIYSGNRNVTLKGGIVMQSMRSIFILGFTRDCIDISEEAIADFVGEDDALIISLG